MERKAQELEKQLRTLQQRFSEIEQSQRRMRQELERFKTLNDIVLSLNTVNDLEHFAAYLGRTVREKLTVDGFALLLAETPEAELQHRSSFGLELAKAQYDFDGEMVYVKDLEGAAAAPQVALPVQARSGTLLGFPLQDPEGKRLGAVLFYRQRPDAFDAGEVAFFRHLSEACAHRLHQIQLFEHTKRLSIKDELTGVFNRRYFNQRYERELQRAKRYKRSLTLIMLDIDHFKLYNDVNGHLLGDRVLQEVARALDGILRKADIIARYGGEEFIIMLPEITKEQALKVADKLRRKIENTAFENEASQPGGKLTISLGLAVYPTDSEDPDHLLKYADDALYLAKTLGRNTVAWHGMTAGKPVKAAVAERQTRPA